MKREASTGVNDCSFHMKDVWYMPRPVTNMARAGLSCMKWLNQCPVECLIIREVWTGVTDRLFSYMKVVLSTAPRDKYVVGRLELYEMIQPVPRGMLDNKGSLNWCEWSFTEFNICKWFYLQATAPRDKYVVGRLQLCEMIKPCSAPRRMLDNTGSLNWCDWSFIQLYESGFIYSAPW
jgi:hypothetical protein